LNKGTPANRKNRVFREVLHNTKKGERGGGGRG